MQFVEMRDANGASSAGVDFRFNVYGAKQGKDGK